MVMFYENRNTLWFGIFLLLSLMVKEEVIFIMVAWGLWIWLVRRDWRWAWAAISAGILWSVLSFSLIAFFRHGGYEYWNQFGNGSSVGPLGILAFAFVHPLNFIRQLMDNPVKFSTLVELFGSFGFLPLTAPLSLVILGPSLLIKLLSNGLPMFDSFHYSSAITPLLALCTIEGVKNLLNFKTTARYLPPYILSVAILANIYYGFSFSYQVFSLRLGSITPADFQITDHSRLLDQILNRIPATASVFCEYPICSHIYRPLGQKMPFPHSGRLDYVIWDRQLPLVLTDWGATVKQITDMNTDYQVVTDTDGIMLVKKIP
jgi:uncharacterized membrane protein